MTDLSSQYPGLIPSYEHERLVALQPYQVLGTPGQQALNDFASIVAKLLDMPIALISLVRADDVVFIGNAGLPEAKVVDRADSMCSVAILQDSLTVFEDVAARPCSLVNPYVAQQMKLGFYAGQALHAPDGMAIGSLCVLDRRPHHLSAAEGELLTQLALVAEDILALQAAGQVSPALRARLDELLLPSLTRLHTLAELRKLDPVVALEADYYTNTRLEEASYLAQSLHRELLAALAEQA